MFQVDKEYKRYFDKVLNSKGFVSSPSLKTLLIYLMECSIQKNPPKEIQIASEIFSKDLSEGSNQDNAIVRVNIHNLRKKLEHYYLTEGKEDEIQFVIPKGRYEIEMARIQPKNIFKAKSYKRFFQKDLLFIYILIILISFLVSFFLSKSKNPDSYNQVAKSLVWKGIIQSNKKIMIVIGDYFFIKDVDSTLNRTTMVRDFSINSYQELTDFINRNPQYAGNYSQAEFTYTGYSTPFVLKKLIPLVSKNDFEVSLMSQFNVKYLQDYNIIFVGLYKTMGYFKNFLNQSGIQINDDRSQVIIADENKSAIYNQEGKSENFHNDFAIAMKLKVSNDNQILLISSFHDIGVTECAKQLTHPESIKQIEKLIREQNGSDDSSFEILFKVLGLNRNDLNSEVIKVNLLDSVSVFGENRMAIF